MKERVKPQYPKPKKPKGLSILTLVALVLGGAIGYVVGETVWISKPHLNHYILIPPFLLVSYLIGEWIFKWRRYQDIL